MLILIIIGAIILIEIGLNIYSDRQLEHLDGMVSTHHGAGEEGSIHIHNEINQ
jgi:hypothetical protein